MFCTPTGVSPMAKKEVQKIEEKAHGMVLYSDGSANPNPGAGGWGLHGYVYSNIAPKKGSGNSMQYLTEKGYIEKVQAQDVKPKEVKPMTYVDGFGSFPYPVTNNVAEISAATHAFSFALTHEDIKKVSLFTDSEYVVKGTASWLQIWKDNNWVKRDGNPVANKEVWQDLDKNLSKLLDKGVEVEVKWVKGHSTYLGNQIADMNADIGTLHSRQNAYRIEFNKTPSDGYWTPKDTRHPFICHRRIYFSSLSAINVPGEYYLGEHGKDDELLGKRTADGCYSYLVLATPDNYIEMLRRKQCEESNGLDSIIMGRLDKLFAATTRSQLDRFGEVCVYRPNNRRLDMHFLDGEPVTKELNPPRLAMRAIDAVNTLKGLLLAWKDNTPNTVTATDLTEVFYEKDAKGSGVLKAEFIVGFSTLPVQVYYGDLSKSQQERVDLCMGVDLPDRNALKKLEKLDPKVTVITWMESEKMFRYATIVKAGESYGIWAGMNSNLRVLT